MSEAKINRSERSQMSFIGAIKTNWQIVNLAARGGSVGCCCTAESSRAKDDEDEGDEVPSVCPTMSEQ